jgi:hypothetical protein
MHTLEKHSESVLQLSFQWRALNNWDYCYNSSRMKVVIFPQGIIEVHHGYEKILLKNY